MPLSTIVFFENDFKSFDDDGGSVLPDILIYPVPTSAPVLADTNAGRVKAYSQSFLLLVILLVLGGLLAIGVVRRLVHRYPWLCPCCLRSKPYVLPIDNNAKDKDGKPIKGKPGSTMDDLDDDMTDVASTQSSMRFSAQNSFNSRRIKIKSTSQKSFRRQKKVMVSPGNGYGSGNGTSPRSDGMDSSPASPASSIVLNINYASELGMRSPMHAVSMKGRSKAMLPELSSDAPPLLKKDTQSHTTNIPSPAHSSIVDIKTPFSQQRSKRNLKIDANLAQTYEDGDYNIDLQHVGFDLDKARSKPINQPASPPADHYLSASSTVREIVSSTKISSSKYRFPMDSSSPSIQDHEVKEAHPPRPAVVIGSMQYHSSRESSASSIDVDIESNTSLVRDPSMKISPSRLKSQASARNISNASDQTATAAAAVTMEGRKPSKWINIVIVEHSPRHGEALSTVSPALGSLPSSQQQLSSKRASTLYSAAITDSSSSDDDNANNLNPIEADERGRPRSSHRKQRSRLQAFDDKDPSIRSIQVSQKLNDDDRDDFNRASITSHRLPLNDEDKLSSRRRGQQAISQRSSESGSNRSPLPSSPSPYPAPDSKVASSQYERGVDQAIREHASIYVNTAPDDGGSGDPYEKKVSATILAKQESLHRSRPSNRLRQRMNSMSPDSNRSINLRGVSVRERQSSTHEDEDLDGDGNIIVKPYREDSIWLHPDSNRHARAMLYDGFDERSPSSIKSSLKSSMRSPHKALSPTLSSPSKLKVTFSELAPIAEVADRPVVALDSRPSATSSSGNLFIAPTNKTSTTAATVEGKMRSPRAIRARQQQDDHTSRSPRQVRVVSHEKEAVEEDNASTHASISSLKTNSTCRKADYASTSRAALYEDDHPAPKKAAPLLKSLSLSKHNLSSHSVPVVLTSARRVEHADEAAALSSSPPSKSFRSPRIIKEPTAHPPELMTSAAAVVVVASAASPSLISPTRRLSKKRPAKLNMDHEEANQGSMRSIAVIGKDASSSSLVKGDHIGRSSVSVYDSNKSWKQHDSSSSGLGKSFRDSRPKLDSFISPRRKDYPAVTSTKAQPTGTPKASPDGSPPSLQLELQHDQVHEVVQLVAHDFRCMESKPSISPLSSRADSLLTAHYANASHAKDATVDHSHQRRQPSTQRASSRRVVVSQSINDQERENSMRSVSVQEREQSFETIASPRQSSDIARVSSYKTNSSWRMKSSAAVDEKLSSPTVTAAASMRHMSMRRNNSLKSTRAMNIDETSALQTKPSAIGMMDTNTANTTATATSSAAVTASKLKSPSHSRFANAAHTAVQVRKMMAWNHHDDHEAKPAGRRPAPAIAVPGLVEERMARATAELVIEHHDDVEEASSPIETHMDDDNGHKSATAKATMFADGVGGVVVLGAMKPQRSSKRTAW
jgi:epidermal growth factor receptor substrate 15